jgi:hypothetical protein
MIYVTIIGNMDTPDPAIPCSLGVILIEERIEEMVRSEQLKAT